MERPLDKTFADAAKSYADHGGESKYLPRIVAQIGGKPLSEIVPPDIVCLAKELYPKQSNASKNRMVLTPVSAVLSHAHQLGWGPVIRLRRFKVDPPLRKKAATQLWLHAFIRQCDKDGLFHVAALVLFMSQTGARVSEAISLKWSDFDLATRTVLLRKVKTTPIQFVTMRTTSLSACLSCGKTPTRKVVHLNTNVDTPLTSG